VSGKGLCIDIPVTWLSAPWWDALGSAGQGIYVSALAWSMGQGMDGDVPRTGLRFIAADTAAAADALDHAVRLNRVAATATGWQFIDWTGMQGQTTAADIQANRERRATNERVRRRRAKSTTNETDSIVHTTVVGEHVADHVADRASTHDRGHVGKGKTEQGTGSGTTTAWPVRIPGTQEWTDGSEHGRAKA
jgi:hypothetical protein